MLRTCCFIPESQQHLVPTRQDEPLPEGVGCGKNAEWEIWSGNSPDDSTDSCTEHVGEMLTDAPEHKIYPINET